MEKKTKIVVFHMKELVYTGIFVVLGIILILLMVFMFMPDKDEKQETTASAQYVAGVYTTSVMLGGSTFDVEVTVNKESINSIELKNVSETVTTMYPLLEPAMDDIANQIYVNQSTENIIYNEDNKYTSLVLINAVEKSLQKALVP